MDTVAVQAALSRLGFAPGSVDGEWGPKTKAAVIAFQKAAELKPDGVVGPQTIKALQAAVAEKAEPRTQAPATGIVPAAWMPTARLERIVFHWTAGNSTASNLDRAHYHILIESDGKLVRGIPSIAANGIGASGPRAEHTRNLNTGSIGVSLCGMTGAIESPFNPGKSPITAIQWKTLADVLADLCRRYDIPVTPRTVLSHAEVEDNLGVKQRQKWDIARLPFAPTVIGAKACGDAMRAAVAAKL